jgi:hypothetical protein
VGERRVPYRFHGQHGEDYLLWHFVDFRKSGFFLDVGAHDFVSLSNTKSFEEQGWSGICPASLPPVMPTEVGIHGWECSRNAVVDADLRRHDGGTPCVRAMA